MFAQVGTGSDLTHPDFLAVSAPRLGGHPSCARGDGRRRSSAAFHPRRARMQKSPTIERRGTRRY
jgi:hypothetical protein